MTFESVKLDHYCYINPEVITKKYPFQLIRYYDISSVNTGFLNEPPKRYYLTESPSRAKRIVRSGDIIISTVRPNRRSFLYLKTVEEGDIASTGFAILRAKQNVDSRFIYYLISEQKFTDYLVSRATGSAYPAVSPESIMNAPVPLLNYAKQKNIADILSSLDDKIELNRQMCKTLEDIASTLFKSWFIDFDPVKAKATDRKPEGLSLEIAELFPNSFIDSSLGKIPSGWMTVPFGSISVNFDSKRIPLSNREREQRKGDYPYYGATGVIDFVNDYIFDGTYLLIGEDGSVIKEDGSPFSQYVWGKFWTNNHTHVLQGVNSFSTEQLYLIMKHMNITPFITGAVQAKLNQKNMNGIMVIKPPQKINHIFNLLIKPIFEKIRFINSQNLVLTNIVKSIHHKLISGSLKINIL